MTEEQFEKAAILRRRIRDLEQHVDHIRSSLPGLIIEVFADCIDYEKYRATVKEKILQLKTELNEL